MVLAEYEREAALLLWLIEKAMKNNEKKDWCNFEELIMNMDFECLEEYIAEEDFFDIGEVVSDLPGLFFEWIASIRLDSVSDYIMNIKSTLDKDNDLALVFNYTETLEKIYGVKRDNICYIHGRRKENYADVEQQYMWTFSDDNQELIIGGMWKDEFNEDKYKDIRGNLVKDTDSILFHNDWFFERIRNTKINRIHSYGYSFSKVDQPYIRKICESINNLKNTEWVNYVYRNEDRVKCEKSLESVGYNGNIRQVYAGK